MTSNFSTKMPALSDPPFMLRKLLKVYIGFEVILFLSALAQGGHADNVYWFQPLLSLARIFFITGVIIQVLPSRLPDVLYLRPFGLDATNDAIRRTLEVSLSPFRLAGIRDPRRRVATYLKPLLESVLVWVYASNRRMSLEAHADWRARLLVSMSEARGVIIDFREPTDFLHQELRLCQHQLDVQRIFLILREDQIFDESQLKALPDGIACFRLKNEFESLKELAKALTAFAQGLDAPTNEVRDEAYTYTLAVSEKQQSEIEAETKRIQFQYAFGWFLLIAFAFLLALLTSYLKDFALFLVAPFILASLAFPVLWIVEKARRNAIGKRLGIKNKSGGAPAGLILFFLAAFSFAAALSQVYRVKQDYDMRGDTLKLLIGPVSSAKIAYAEYYLEHKRAPTTAELSPLLSSVPDKNVSTTVDSEGIKISIVDPANKVLNGQYLQLVPAINGDNLTFSCRPSSAFPREYLPRFLCPN